MQFETIEPYLTMWLESFSFSGLWDFFLFGFLMNIAGLILMLTVSMIKTSRFDEVQLGLFMVFLDMRKDIVSNHVSGTRRFWRNMLFLFPCHMFIGACVFTWYAMTTKGASGLFKGVMGVERVAMIPLVVFQESDSKIDISEHDK